MIKKRNRFGFGKRFLIIVLVIILLVCVGFYFKGTTGNAVLGNYSNTEYAPPYDVLNDNAPIFNISSDSLVAVGDQVNLRVNVSVARGYIYQKGYVFNQLTKDWEVFNFNQTPVENSYWISGVASKDLVINVSNRVHNNSETYIVAYACYKKNKVWQCGCQSTADTNCKRWMLHKFDITNITISPEINCTSNANCTMTNGTCDPIRKVCVTEGIFPLGTSQNPFKITSWATLNAVRNNLTASYILMNDLDKNSVNYSNYASSTADIGQGWQPIGNSFSPFSGNFNGNGKNISDLFMNRAYENMGLFSYLSGNISNISLNNINVTGSDKVGGLVGFLTGRVSYSSCNGFISAASHSGGLVGYSEGNISSSYSIVNISGVQYTGGLVGYSTGSVSSSYSIVNISSGYVSGGLVGYSTGQVLNSYTSGFIFGYDQYIGCLIGQSAGGQVYDSYSSCIISGTSRVGGLVGDNSGNIFNSYATGNVTGSSNIGGLVGFSGGLISNSYATGNVNGSGNYIGGLFGSISNIKVNNSYATGSVTGISYVGGFTGVAYHINTRINNSYATGNVTGSSRIGGFVGNFDAGIINNSYSTGRITNFTSTYIGGFIGYRSAGVAFVYNSFWDNQTSGKLTSILGMPKNTTQMKTSSTFTTAGWDLTNIWAIDAIKNNGYPYLRWQAL